MKAIRRHVLFALVAAGTLAASPAHAQSLYTCGQATVREVESRVQIRPAAAEAAGGEGGTAVDTPTSEKRTDYLITVRLGTREYTARAAADIAWNLDPRELAKDEPVQVCTNGRQLVLDRLDGSDFHATIVRVTSGDVSAARR